MTDDAHGLDEEVFDCLGRTLKVATFYGWGWTNPGTSDMQPPDPFEMELVDLWRFDDVLRGGYGPVITPGHEAEGLWCVFGTRHYGSYNFRDKVGHYNVQLGRGRPRINAEGWPVCAEGLYHGFGSIQLEDDDN